MNEPDQSTAAAPRPHRPKGDPHGSPKSDHEPNRLTGALNHHSDASSSTGLWARIKGYFSAANPSLREDLSLALQAEGDEATSFSGTERTMLANVLKLSGMRVEDVMVPRVDIEAVDEEESLGQLVEKLRHSGH
ncbi:MAG: hypothetical protein L3J33_05165, partial [Rhodobacteraceae bacterium]|nr:hypothetical protein [Paracoccaceae bacterium]